MKPKYIIMEKEGEVSGKIYRVRLSLLKKGKKNPKIEDYKKREYKEVIK